MSTLFNVFLCLEQMNDELHSVYINFFHCKNSFEVQCIKRFHAGSINNLSAASIVDSQLVCMTGPKKAALTKIALIEDFFLHF